MRLRAFTPLLASLLLLAGCGGASIVSAKSSSGGMPAGADEVPAAAPVFVTVDTSFGDQWNSLNALLDKFPGKDQLVSSIQQSLTKAGIDFDKDIKQTIGPELDVAVFDIANGTSGSKARVVGLTQPKDKAGFEAALQKGSAPHPVYKESGDWVLFARDQATLDAYAQLTGDKLSSSADFKAAFDKLPDGALARAYVDAASIQKTVSDKLKVAVGGTSLRWVAASAKAQDDGIKVDAYLKTDGGSASNFDSSLLDKVPAGALVALAYDGKTFGLDEQIQKLGTSSGQAGQVVTAVEQATGVKVGDLVAALGGQGVLYVRPGSPIPEVTLLEKGIDVDAAVQTIDTLATHLHAPPKSATVAGENVRQVSVQGLTITYGNIDGMLVVTSGANTIQDLKSGGSSLTSSDEFKQAQKSSGVSGDVSGLLYVDVPSTISYVETLLQLTGNGSKVPAQLTDNADHVHSVYAAAHADDKDTTHAVLFVHVQ